MVTAIPAGCQECMLIQDTLHSLLAARRHAGLRLTTLLQVSSGLAVQEFDGGARGNPGPSGAGAVLYNVATGEEVCSSEVLAHKDVPQK